MRMSPTSVAASSVTVVIMLAATGCSSTPTTPRTVPFGSSSDSTTGLSAPPGVSGSSTAASTPAPSSPAASPTGSRSPSATAGPKPVVTESNPPGDIPDNQAFVATTPPGAHFSVKVPEGWAAQHTSTGTFFTDKLNAIAISFQPAGAAPTIASAQGAGVAQLTAAEPQFQLKGVTAVTRHAGPAVLVHYERDSAQNDVTGKVVREDVYRYEFFHAGVEVDLVLSGPVGADNVDPWRTVTDSLTWS